MRSEGHSCQKGKNFSDKEATEPPERNAFRRLYSLVGKAMRGVITTKGWLCEMADAFSLKFHKFQMDNQQNALAMDSADGKAGEKVCIFTARQR